MKLALILAVLCLLGLPPLARSIQPFEGPTQDTQDLSSWRPSPTILRALAVGYRAAASDFYWLGTIQYYGTRSSEQAKYRGLVPLLEATTNLDPLFDYPYQFAGQCVPYNDVDSKLWYNTSAAIDLLRKGVDAGVQRWQVPWLLGYSLYTFRGIYAEAGQLMLEASRRPHAPAYLEFLATRLLAQGDKIETAIATTRVALAEAVEDRTKTELQSRLNSLVLQQQIEELDQKLDERRAAGLPTRTDQDLLDAIAPAGLPEDPFGGRFSIDATTGKVRSSNEDKLLRVHIHPGAPPVEKVFD